MNSEPSPRRSYRQNARAEAAEATGERILDGLIQRLRHLSFNSEITLDMIAGDAGVTVQTVVRRFGGKDGALMAARERLQQEISARRSVEPGDIDAAIAALADDYEILGDLILHLLEQEKRNPAIAEVLASGRAGHRAWVTMTLAPSLSASLNGGTLDALTVATDVYVWKLVRRDMGRSPDAYRQLVMQLIRPLLGD